MDIDLLIALTCICLPLFVFEFIGRQCFSTNFNEIVQLSGLRGLAALSVLMSHFPNIIRPYAGPSAGGYGDYGVFLFFMLSGFLMGQLYLPAPFTCTNVKAFALARAGRILPLYLVVLIVTSLSMDSEVLGESPSMSVLCGLEFAWAPMQLWTVTVEAQFYLFFVFLWSAYSKIGMSVFLLIACYTSLRILYMLNDDPTSVLVTCTCKHEWCTPQFVPIFCVGAACGVQWQSVARNISRAPYLAAVGIAVLFAHKYALQPLWAFVPGGALIYTHRNWAPNSLPLDPVVYVSAALCIIGAAQSIPILGFLGSRPLVLCGKISYGLYMIHLQVFVVTHSLFENRSVLFRSLAMLSATSLMCGVALASFLYFELPVARYIRSYPEGKSKSAVTLV